MLSTFALKTLLAYRQECFNLTLKEAIEYLIERGHDFCPNERVTNFYCNENSIKRILFCDKYGEDAIPTRIYLLMSGGFPNFDTIDDADKAEIKVFNQRWEIVFKDI